MNVLYKATQGKIDSDKASGRGVSDLYSLGRLPAPVPPPGTPGAAPAGPAGPAGAAGAPAAAAPKPAAAPAPSAPASLSGTERKAVKQAGTH